MCVYVYVCVFIGLLASTPPPAKLPSTMPHRRPLPAFPSSLQTAPPGYSGEASLPGLRVKRSAQLLPHRSDVHRSGLDEPLLHVTRADSELPRLDMTADTTGLPSVFPELTVMTTSRTEAEPWSPQASRSPLQEKGRSGAMPKAFSQMQARNTPAVHGASSSRAIPPCVPYVKPLSKLTPHDAARSTFCPTHS